MYICVCVCVWMWEAVETNSCGTLFFVQFRWLSGGKWVKLTCDFARSAVWLTTEIVETKLTISTLVRTTTRPSDWVCKHHPACIKRREIKTITCRVFTPGRFQLICKCVWNLQNNPEDWQNAELFPAKAVCIRVYGPRCAKNSWYEKWSTPGSLATSKITWIA